VAQLLLVEDDAAIRGALIRALTERGHAVASSPGAMSALRQILDTPPDLVLLDLGLPDLEGYEAIRAVLRRASQPDAKRGVPLEVGGLRLDIDAHEATLDGARLDLSRREFDLLHYLVMHADQVVARRDLLTNVWRMPYGGADKTVDVHISWLRRKLGETAQQPRYLHTVRGVGVKLSAPR